MHTRNSPSGETSKIYNTERLAKCLTQAAICSALYSCVSSILRSKLKHIRRRYCNEFVTLLFCLIGETIYACVRTRNRCDVDFVSDVNKQGNLNSIKLPILDFLLI